MENKKNPCGVVFTISYISLLALFWVFMENRGLSSSLKKMEKRETKEIVEITRERDQLKRERNLYRTLFQLMYIKTTFNKEDKKKISFLHKYILEVNPHLYLKVNINDLAQSILKACNDHGYDWLTIVALIDVESGFDPYAKSHKNARGLCQIIYRYWKHYIPEEKRENPDILFDPYTNVVVAGQILKELRLKFNDQEEMFNYYSGGHEFYYRKITTTKTTLQKKFKMFKKRRRNI